MATAVKRAISLPKEQDEELKKIAAKRHSSFSSLVQDAVRFFLRRLEQEELDQSYEHYYAKKEMVERTRRTVAEMRKLSRKVWH